MARNGLPVSLATAFQILPISVYLMRISSLTTYVCCVPSLHASSERTAWSATDEGGQVSGVAGPQLGLDSLSTPSPQKADRTCIPGNSNSLEIYPSLGCDPPSSLPYVTRRNQELMSVRRPVRWGNQMWRLSDWINLLAASLSDRCSVLK